MRFEIYASGDPSTGNGDHTATVDIPYMVEGDDELLRDTVEELKRCFSNLFDSRARVVKVDDSNLG